MFDLQIQLDRIEKTVIQILEAVNEERSPLSDKWLTEPQVMKILNLTKRGVSDLRRKNVFRVSTGTGRNFLYYKADIENYIYSNSAVGKRRKSK
jgi:hypothetical protein